MELENLSDKELLELYRKTDNNVKVYDGLQLSTKIFANAFYGGLANPFSRWFSYDIAESITLTGQLASKYVEKYVNTYLNNLLKTTDVDYVIAVDTDSCYINLEAVVKKAFKGENPSREETTRFLEKFSKALQEEAIEAAMQDLYKTTNAYQPKLFMKLEVIGQAIWRKAKNYVMGIFYSEGVFYDEMKIKMKGIEAVKSSTPEVCRDYIKSAIPIVLSGDSNRLRDYIEECREEFHSLPFEKVAKPGGVNGINKYSDKRTIYSQGTPMHVRAALLYNHLISEKKLEDIYEKISDGGKIKFSYLKMPNPIKENVIASIDELPEEFDLTEFIDYETQFEKTFLKPIESIYKHAGMNISNKIDISQFKG